MRGSLVRGAKKVHRLTCLTSFVLFRNVLVQFQSVVGGHVDKINPVFDLRIFCRDCARAAKHFVVLPCLTCWYCWAFNNQVKGMTEDVARRSIDWLYDHWLPRSGADGRRGY